MSMINAVVMDMTIILLDPKHIISVHQGREKLSIGDNYESHDIAIVSMSTGASYKVFDEDRKLSKSVQKAKRTYITVVGDHAADTLKGAEDTTFLGSPAHLD